MLDRGRPYATIYGAMEDYPLARFMQDGQLYTAKGEPLDAPKYPDADRLSYKDVRRLVAQEGGRFENRARGVAFLKTLKA